MGQVDPHGNLTETAYGRIAAAIDYFENNPDIQIVCPAKGSYAVSSEHEVTEAEEIARCLVGFGVPRKNILLEEKSCDTIGGAYFLKVDFAIPLHIHNIVVVTSEDHVPRTKFCFELVFGSEFSIEFVQTKNLSDDESQYEQDVLREKKTLKLMKETWFKNIEAGDHEAVWHALQNHPGYNKSSTITVDVIKSSIEKTEI